MYQVPNFLADVQDFRCINTSNRKLLKPAIDLATRVQQESLTYLLDIFPGLYCQRVTTGACPPVSTISQPVLLVAFDSSQGQARTQPEIGQNDAHLQYEMEENSQPTQLEGITIHPYSQHVRNENNQPFQPETETNHPSERDGRNEKNQYPIPGSSTNHPNVQCERNKNDPSTQTGRNNRHDQAQRPNHRSLGNKQTNRSDLSNTRPAGRNQKQPPARPDLKSGGLLQSAKNVLGWSE
jgi:hypothetical protein